MIFIFIVVALFAYVVPALGFIFALNLMFKPPVTPFQVSVIILLIIQSIIIFSIGFDGMFRLIIGPIRFN